MDILLQKFHTSKELHELALSHAKEKGMKLNELNIFYQPQAWDIMTSAIENGQYHTPPSEIHYLDKLTGKPMTYQQAMDRNMVEVRELNVLPRKDRVVWNAFYKIAYDRFEDKIHDSCVSYKRGIGTPRIANNLSKELQRLGNYTVIKGDLRKFFDRVPIEVIDETLDMFESEEPSAIWKVIRECYHDNRVVVNGEMIERYTSLRQGNPIGCLLADIILADIDQAMTEYDVTYLRYSDDFIIVGNSKECHRAFNKFNTMLNAKGIELNDAKTEIKTQRQWFKFLGFRFKGSQVSISEKTLKNMTHKIKMETISQCRKNKRALTEKELKRAIDNIEYYMYQGCKKSNCGMARYMYIAGVDSVDINTIDTYVKDCIQAAYTNKCNIYGLGMSYGEHGINGNRNTKGKNVGMNRAKAEHIPHELGWYSMNHMKQKYLQGKEVYNMEILHMENGYLCD